MPEAGAHVWEWYQRVAATRQNGMAVNPISYQEIRSWALLTGRRLAEWEVDALIGIDGAFRASLA